MQQWLRRRACWAIAAMAVGSGWDGRCAAVFRDTGPRSRGSAASGEAAGQFGVHSRCSLGVPLRRLLTSVLLYPAEVSLVICRSMLWIVACSAVLMGAASAGAAGANAVDDGANASAAGTPFVPRPDQLEFRELYRELVETNTTHSSGSCTEAANKMALRLRQAGFSESDIHLFGVTEHPKDGGLVAVLHGTDPGAKAILLLAHLDVVEARREDWTRDPFKLVEEGGYFYARGAFDDKSMAAVWVDTLLRLRKERFSAKRGVKLALTCGEEAGAVFSGAEYLALHERELIDAAFALN
ncbi:MAG: hypothetical protein QOD56_649, partial [Gammaproteobacteria bacterium]|nr:hypothetical protein [Gammaproteobacteria bacterium]